MPPKPSPNNPADKPLTLKQQRFVREYLVDGNATQAAIRAGYSTHHSVTQTASQLLRSPHVALAVQEAEASRIAANSPAIAHKPPEWLTVSYVVVKLRHTLEMALNDGAYPAANKSLELLGRHLRMWSDDEGSRRGGAQTVNIDKIVYHLDHGNGPEPPKVIETSVVDVDSQGDEGLRAEQASSEAAGEPT